MVEAKIIYLLMMFSEGNTKHFACVSVALYHKGSGELKKAVETLACSLRFPSISCSSKLLPIFGYKNSKGSKT